MPVARCEEISDSYARTLAIWRERFNDAWPSAARRTATTRASAACGTSTSRFRRAAFASGGSATCRWCSRRPAGAPGGPMAIAYTRSRQRRASSPRPRPRRVAADLGAGDRPAGGRARRDRGRPAGLRRVAGAARRRSRRRPANLGGGGRRALRRSSGSSARTSPATRSAAGWRSSSPRPGRRGLGLRDLPGRPLAAAARAAARRLPGAGDAAAPAVAAGAGLGADARRRPAHNRRPARAAQPRRGEGG